MKIANLFLVLSSAGLAAAAIYGSPAGAENDNELSRAEQACQRALDKGTEDALQAFLRQYPGSDTACTAFASTEVSQNDGSSGSSSGANSSGSSSSSSGSSSSSSGSSSSSSGLGNPGNNSPVGHSGEAPPHGGGEGFGGGDRGKSR